MPCPLGLFLRDRYPGNQADGRDGLGRGTKPCLGHDRVLMISEHLLYVGDRTGELTSVPTAYLSGGLGRITTAFGRDTNHVKFFVGRLCRKFLRCPSQSTPPVCHQLLNNSTRRPGRDLRAIVNKVGFKRCSD